MSIYRCSFGKYYQAEETVIFFGLSWLSEGSKNRKFHGYCIEGKFFL